MNFPTVSPDALDAPSHTTPPTSPLATSSAPPPPSATPSAPPPASQSAPPSTSRRDEQPERIHYTNEFHVYRKARANGNGITKRARCNHCSGDWAYNETRLKNHIVDPYRGCRRVPPEIRERIRAADAQHSAGAGAVPPTAAALGVGAHAPVLGAHISPHQPLPPPKRKREATLSTLAAASPSVAAAAALRSGALTLTNDAAINAQLVSGAGVHANGEHGATDDAPPSHVRVAVEFSMTSGGLLRATWIASELISEFHRDILDVGLIPRTAENTFNVWIGGKIAWSRGVGQPLPDYDHLRPIIRNQCCHAHDL